MTVRDASRIKLFFPAVDTDADGSYADQANAGFVCVTGNVSWSGFKRQSVSTLCTENTVDGWGNIIKTFRAGRFIDYGTLTFDVDFDPVEANIPISAFKQTGNRNYRMDFPAEAGETTGPKITLPGHFTDFTPMTQALQEGDNARSRATMVLKISAEITYTAPV